MSTNYQYINQSRGYKTKGNTYKDRYVDKDCPECGHVRAYKDEWRTRNAYTCLKRACRHKWYTNKDISTGEEESAATDEKSE
jgi:hypothetical protein